MSTWKTDFYGAYYSFFGRKLTKEDYKTFIPYGQHIIKNCFPRDKSIKIMDMGCGIGGFIKVFRDSGYLNVMGIDASQESVVFANMCGVHQVQHGEIFDSFKKMEDEELDVILFLDVLEHFKIEDNIELLREANRVLKPSGSVIIHVPNASGIFGSKIRYADITHEMAFTESSLTQLTRYVGFNQCICFEDKPIIHGVVSIIRRFYWMLATAGFRLLHAAETGSFKIKLSQNILFQATKA